MCIRDRRKILRILEGWEDLLYCDIRLYDISTELTVISGLKAEIFELIDSRLTSDELRRLTEKRKGTYPGDFALWKLAKQAYHKMDFKYAKSLLDDFITRYPLSEHYREARRMYERLAGSRSPHKNVIGVMLPLSGTYSSVGELALQGIWLASGFFTKEKGPYDGFELVIKDTGGDADMALSLIHI